MRRERRRGIARTLAFIWVLAAGPVRALAPEADAEALPTGSADCATAVSCGFGCTAELVTGVCIQAVKWTGGVQIGGIQIGPKISVECGVCECWYTYSNDASNRLFKRTTSLSCGGTIVGVQTYVV